MNTFKDVKIGETFYTSNGQPSKKLDENHAIGLNDEYCGFDFQELRKPSKFKMNLNDHIYGINK